MLSDLRYRLRAIFRRDAMERELATELQLHYEREVAKLTAAGMSPADAQRRARLAMGGLEQVKEATRDAWGVTFFESTARDTAHAFRLLRRNPGFTAAVTLSLAMGIGANTTVFSLLDAVLLRSLPVRNPQELLVFAHRGDKDPSTGSNYPLFQTLHDQSKSFSDVLAFWPIEFRLRSDTESEMTEGHYVTTNYFSLLGVQPIAGRAFSDSDFEQLVTVISYGLWQRTFGRSPDVVGRTLQVNGIPLTVIGVAPPEFFGLQLGWKLDLFVPFGLQKRLSPEFGDRLAIRGGVWNLAIMGRLKKGVSPEVARSEAELLVNPWVNEFVAKEAGATRGDWATIEFLSGSRGLDALRRRFSKPLRVLMIVAALVLLISCANIANLLLGRAINRQKEIAVRASIGASRMRLVFQLLTESLLLSLVGGVASMLLAVWCARLLVIYISDPSRPLVLSVDIDARMLGFTAVVSLLTSVIFGVLPAWRATRVDLTPALRDQQPTAQTGSTGLLRRILIGLQVALSLLLVIDAGLFVRNLSTIRDLDPGFNPDRLLLVEVNPSGLRLTGERLEERLHSYWQEMLQRLEVLPGVQSVSFASLAPLTGSNTTRRFTSASFTARQLSDSVVRVNAISSTYFATMGVPITSGRSFSHADGAGAPRVAILNEAAARFHFSGTTPLGKTFRLGSNNSSPLIEIVGVARDTKQRDLREPVGRTVFLPFEQSPGAFGSIQVRATGDAANLIAAIRARARSVDAEIPIASIRTVREQVDSSLSQERLIALLSATLGGLAVFLAAMGLYGVVSYSVSARPGEIGIRMALGAGRGSVLVLVAKDIAVPVCLGMMGGLIATLATASLLRTMLFSLSPTDTVTFVIGSLSLAAVACLAGLLPARRAVRIDPAVALRNG